MNTIKIKYGLEEITSRIPGLFPYMEFDDNHVSTIHSASDSNSGCYGKIVCGISVPSDVDLIVDNNYVVRGGNSYSYRTLMNYYYTYKEVFPTNSFIQFMERGIGLFKIADYMPIEVNGENATIDFDECILVPEYEYYANTGRLYNTYAKMKIMCDKYIEIKEATGEVNCELECLLDKYSKMGGDVMLEFYKIMSQQAYTIAEEYYNYKSDSFNLFFDINIVSDNCDLGILNTYLNYFDPGWIYYKGDEVIYNDRTYVCCSETHKGPWDDVHFSLISDTGPNNEICVYIPPFDANEHYHNGEFVRRYELGQVYKCELPDYVEYNIGEVIGVGSVYYVKNGDEYIEDNSLELPHVVEDGEEYYKKGPEIYQGQWSASIFKPIDIEGVSESKLTGFRRNVNFIDAGGNIKYPESSVDWLWYYRIGDIGFYETTTDELNNILLLSGQRVNIGQYETKLMAYGDVITNITRDKENKTITFNYVIGAHLKAKYLHYYEDDDKNPHYCYGEFEYDDNDLHGISYTDTYSYSDGGDIDRMSDDEFQKYVSYSKYTKYNSGSLIDAGDIYYIKEDDEYIQHINQTSEPIVVPVLDNRYYYERWVPAREINDVYSQCEFTTYLNSDVSVFGVNDSIEQYPYILSDFSCKFNPEMDTLCSVTTKLDYLTGVTYSPTVDTDVQVRRGDASAWERHIKMGEIFSINDMETYANGGFFKLR